MLIIENIKETSFLGQPVTKLTAYSWLCKAVLTPPIPQFTLLRFILEARLPSSRACFVRRGQRDVDKVFIA